MAGDTRTSVRCVAARAPLLVVGVLWASFHEQIGAVHAPRPGGAHRHNLAFAPAGFCGGSKRNVARLPAAALALAPAAHGGRLTLGTAPRGRGRGRGRGAACLAMNVESFNMGDGASRIYWNEDPVAEAMAGSWKVEWTQDDKRRSTVVNLQADGRVSPPDDSEKTRMEKVLDQQLPQPKGKAVMLFGTWRLKGEDVSIVIQRHTTSEGKKYGQATILFQGMIRNESNCPYGSKVMGNVLEGDSEPEFMGKFNLTQMVGKASLGLGPAGPTPKETRASSGFRLGGRSDVKVLKRFSGAWDATISLDGTRCSAAFEMLPDGTFYTTAYQKFSESGVTAGGVLRGRWNVYYSEDTKKERFWMQVKRLKSTGVNLWQDLLFLGDIDVVDTWKDIKDVLAQQMALASSNETASSAAGDPVPPKMETSDSNDLTGFELSEAEGTPSVSPHNVALTPEDRGIFTSGKQRKYRLGGSIVVGWMGEPAFVGKFQMVQAHRLDTETLERSSDE